MNSIINIENFKCFYHPSQILISKLTICTGMNSVGKSTLIQTLLLMRQTFESIKTTHALQSLPHILLNTSAIKLGSTDQIMVTSQSMKLSIDDVHMSFISGEDMISLLCKQPILNSEKEFSENTHSFLFNSHFYYLNAERFGPRNYQELISRDSFDCGYHGEYTFNTIAQKCDDEISKERLFPFDRAKKIPHLEKQIEYWLGYIVNGIEVKFTSNLTTQLAQMQVRQSSLDTKLGSPYNFGFGISYILSIITTGLIAKENSIFIVENPEAHLHPAGQSRIGEFLAHISNAHVQVIIETHSEHVINGIRKYALRNSICPDDICINYFDIVPSKKTENNFSGFEHSVRRLSLNERMDILDWPDGFFDQEAKDLKELRELRSNKK